jgi:WD40 repeat protein
VFSSDSYVLAYGCSDGTFGLYDIKNKENLRCQNAHDEGIPVCSVALNSNETYLATASKTGKIIVQKLVKNEGKLTFGEEIVFKENEVILNLIIIIYRK